MSENKNSYTKFMIMKKLYKDGNKQVYLLSNKNGYKKAAACPGTAAAFFAFKRANPAGG